ncbi:MAG: peptide chain release factor-like protein [Phycisphaerales bacterium]|nr:peptide chain release factor-like protein [Phycisphaerales bacterium]
MNFAMIDPPHPASLPEKKFLEQCDLQTGRGHGPGGQHRNKVETAVSITHRPTALVANAQERRSQYENRKEAIRRLRQALARKVRTNVKPHHYRPSSLWEKRRTGRAVPVNAKHVDYPALLAESLDLINACHFDVAQAAGQLGVSMSQLAKLIKNDRHAMVLVNEGRTQRGLRALK